LCFKLIFVFVLWDKYVFAGVKGQQTTKSKVQPSDDECPQSAYVILLANYQSTKKIFDTCYWS
jgi:hypothetical protein